MGSGTWMAGTWSRPSRISEQNRRRGRLKDDVVLARIQQWEGEPEDGRLRAGQEGRGRPSGKPGSKYVHRSSLLQQGGSATRLQLATCPPLDSGCSPGVRPLSECMHLQARRGGPKRTSTRCTTQPAEGSRRECPRTTSAASSGGPSQARPGPDTLSLSLSHTHTLEREIERERGRGRDRDRHTQRGRGRER